jgi:crotonobetainyl-CoA:carnitine CoA-transferase CaiB-like acyl-CoA transferase
MLQSAFMQEYEGRVWNEPGGLDCKGSGPLSRMYQAADGWVFMAARPGDLAGCPALADLGGAGVDAALEQTLEERFKGRTVQAWVELLTAAGIGAHRVIEQFTEMMEDPQVIRQGLSITREHQGQGLITTNGPAPRLSHTPMVPGCPAPMPGADAAGILGEIGMAGDLERLIAAGVVRVDGVVPGGAS